MTVGDDFTPVYRLAEKITAEKNRYTVTLRDAKFSDGSRVTADDVINSCSLAKASAVYSHSFYEVSSFTAADSKTVIFELSKNDPYFANLLTFPILKKGSEALKNEDNVEIVPVGAGAFIFDDKKAMLTKNVNYYGKCDVDYITLVDAPDRESLEHYIEIGATDYYLTDPVNGNIVRMSGKKLALNTTSFVYLGVNHNYAPLSDSLLRQAISAAIDRALICETAFYDYAKPATGFFHPDFKDTSGYQTIQIKADSKISVENLTEIGYNSLDAEGYRVDSKGKRLALSLLVNDSNPARVSTANMIKAQLESVGIYVTVNAVSYERYMAALKNGQFQLYVGEVTVTPNMDMGELVTAGKKAAFGIPASGALSYKAVLDGYAKGTNGIGEIATALITDLPMIPLLYRNKLLFYSEEALVGNVSAYDIFLSITHFE